MKVLSLYIDKWYIVGTITDGVNKIPLSLSNAEERIWLYFYSNSTTNAVKYSLTYKDEALAGKKGYYADVFDILPDYKEYHYEKYGARKQMSGIFADANIFADLKKSFGAESSVPVYISFSDDIDIVAQDIFIKALKDEHFKVLQFTLPIERLSLEYLVWHGRITEEDKKVLVVNACNENLRYSIYNVEPAGASVILQKCEPGYGVDSRKQAVVEEVMEYLQADTHFLTGAKDEWNNEVLYLSQFADEWIKRIDHSSDVAPVALGSIHFKKQLHNEVPVVVSVADLNDRTKNIVGKLTGKVVDMIKEAGVPLYQISHIVFLGDMFGSHTFSESLRQKIGIAAENVVFYQETELPELVSVYEKWGGNAFNTEKELRLNNARKKKDQDCKKAIEQKTRDLKDKALVAEDEGRLQDAVNLYERVLKIDKNDKYSSAQIPALLAQIEQDKKNRERIEELLEKARQNFCASDYRQAIQNSEEVLRLQNNNSDAQKIKEDAEKALKRRELLEGYISKMNDFLMEGHFYDARNVLQKVDVLNVNDVRLKEIREKTEKGIANLESQVKEKTNAYNIAFSAKDYQQCLRLCEDLLAMGADSSVWTEQRQFINEKLKEEQKFQDNYELARTARLKHNWSEVVEYAQKALGIRNDADIRAILQEAENKISEIHQKKQFEETLNQIKALADKGIFDEAESKLNSLERSIKRAGLIDEKMERLIKSMRKRLFNFGTPNGDDFFGRSSSSANHDDFFECQNFEKKKQTYKQISELSNKITNEDFNF